MSLFWLGIIIFACGAIMRLACNIYPGNIAKVII